MKAAKRIFAVVLVLVMILTIGVGCSNEELENTLSDLQSQIDALKSENSTLKSQNTTLDGKIKDLQDQIDDLEADLATKQTAITQLTAKLVGIDYIAESLFGSSVSENLVALQGLSDAVAETLEEQKIVILHTNDIHGKLVAGTDNFGFESIIALRRVYERLGYSVITVDAGDAIQGTAYTVASQGLVATEFMNLAEFDIAVPGNHEFDWGLSNFMSLVGASRAQYISANIVYTADYPTIPDGKSAGDLVFAPNTVVDVRGVKIGFFGLTTPESATKAHPDKIKGIEFKAGNDLYTIAQEQATYLRDTEKCDVVVALGHLGIDGESDPNRSTDVIKKVNGIDLFIDGHSHSVIEHEEVSQKTTSKKTILASTGTGFANIGVVGFEDNKPISHLLDAKGIGKSLTFLANVTDYEIVSIMYEIIAEIDVILAEVVAETEVALVGEKAFVRAQETNLGNLATDAMLWAAAEMYDDMDIHGAITNGGGIREPLAVGDITIGQLISVFPFGNSVVILTMTGEELWEALEAATYVFEAGETGQTIGAFPQVAGIEFELDITKEWVQGTQYPNSTYYAPGYTNGIANANKRVTIKKVGGVTFDKDAEYNIVTNDFLAAGGDSYGVFVGLDIIYTGIGLETAFVEFICETVANGGLGGKVTTAKYGPATVGKRIKIITSTTPAA